ncbi:MAG: HAMP domain-containing protein, partial [Magnetococcales bacterium]|nr:HAMP domain-containing protein [Magnetococcales bacterium]
GDSSMVLGEMFNHHTAESRPVHPQVDRLLSKNGLLSHRKSEMEGAVHSGLLALDDGVLMMVVQPILTSRGDGPVHGVLVMGRWLTSEEMITIGNRNRFELSLFPTDATILPVDIEQISRQLSPSHPEHIERWGLYAMSGYALVEDILGRHAILFRVDGNRTITRQREESLNQLLAWVLSAGFLFGLALMVIIQQWVVGPVTRLSDSVTSIGDQGDLTARVPVETGDQIGTLARRINQMLEQLQRTGDALQQAHDDMEQRVHQRTAELLNVNKELTQEIGERKRAESALFNREQLLETVSFSARRLLTEHHLESVLAPVLERLGSSLGVSGVVVFRFPTPSPGSEAQEPPPTPLATWMSDGEGSDEASAMAQYLKKAPTCTRMMRRLQEDQPTWSQADQEDPEMDTVMAVLGVTSLMAIPIIVEHRSWGILALFETELVRRWSETELDGVLAVADSFSAAVERSLAEQRVLRSREQLRSLSYHLQNAREAEKKHIAAEIHDELGSLLTKLKMDLSLLVKRVADDESLAQRVVQMRSLTDRTIRTVRQISTSLRPKILDQLGLLAAIEWQVEEFTDHTEIPCHLDPESQDLDLDEARRTALFRICQESLTNIARHAEATEVEVALKLKEHHVHMTISDNGKGFDPNLANRLDAHGLRGMWERAAQFDGIVELASAVGQGTEVDVRFPRLESDEIQAG